MPELGLELVRDVDRERFRSRLPRWDPRLWGDAQFSKNTRPGNRLLKLGLAWGRERVKARKLQQENVTPRSDVAPVSRFTGKEEDVEVGLQYFGKRYLSPYLGRWISADPLAVHASGAADLNLYAYVKGAVLKAIDPIGLDVYAREEAGPPPAPTQGEDGGTVTTINTICLFDTDAPTLGDLKATDTFDGQTLGFSADASGVMNLERPVIERAPIDVPFNRDIGKDMVNAGVSLVVHTLGLPFSGSPEGAENVRQVMDAARPFPEQKDELREAIFSALMGLGIPFGEAAAAARLPQVPKLVLNPRLTAAATARAADPVIEIGTSELQLYGPYRHGVNNFKIDKILTEQLLSSSRRDLVYATEGSLDTVIPSKINRPFVEFYTFEPPVSTNPAEVMWRNPTDILVTRTLQPNGQIVNVATPF